MNKFFVYSHYTRLTNFGNNNARYKKSNFELKHHDSSGTC